MKKGLSTAIALASLSLASAGYAQDLNTSQAFPSYSYEPTLRVNFAPSAEPEAIESYVFAGDYNQQINQNYFFSGQVAIAEAQDKDDNLSRQRYSIGGGYQRNLAGGEGSLQLGAKLYALRTDLGRGTESESGYGLFASLRHFYANDILDLNLPGLWEGFFLLERQDIIEKTLLLDFGMRYHFDAKTSFELATGIAEDDLYAGGVLKQIRLGLQFKL